LKWQEKFVFRRRPNLSFVHYAGQENSIRTPGNTISAAQLNKMSVALAFGEDLLDFSHRYSGRSQSDLRDEGQENDARQISGRKWSILLRGGVI
jgi:hypothetical protein